MKAQRPPGDGEGPSNIRFTDSGEAVRVPVKVTSKMAARAQYEKELAELGSEEEGELEVIDDAGDADDEAASSEPRQDKGKGKAVDSADAGEQMPGRKRRRAPMDPFAGTWIYIPSLVLVTTILSGRSWRRYNSADSQKEQSQRRRCRRGKGQLNTGQQRAKYTVVFSRGCEEREESCQESEEEGETRGVYGLKVAMTL